MVRDVCDEGIVNLIVGICNRAAQDIVERSPKSKYHQDAAAFYRSDYFTLLTGMDGAPILEQLEVKGAARRYKTLRSKREKVAE